MGEQNHNIAPAPLKEPGLSCAAGALEENFFFLLVDPWISKNSVIPAFSR